MISRLISQYIKDNAAWLPVVSLTGPRQSGKSTLVKELFADYKYVNLEDDAIFERVSMSPIDFIKEQPSGMVIDEAQRVPELFNAIQIVSDERGTAGQYILSGSQNFLLLKSITQSLAGRVCLAKLLPFAYKEISQANINCSTDDFMLRGGYPRLYDVDMPSSVYYENYISTYLERDVAGYVSVRNIATFRNFLLLCASAAGSLLNTSRLATDLGVSRATIDSWLSILEASYILFRLHPYHKNVRKRLSKTPKLYFYDTGLLCHLLSIDSLQVLLDSTSRGAIFENFVIEETFKRHLNAGKTPRLFFYRDDSKIEIDLVDCTNDHELELIEIKSQMGFQKEFLRHLPAIGDVLEIPSDKRFVVTRGSETFIVNKMKVWAIRDWLMR